MLNDDGIAANSRLGDLRSKELNVKVRMRPRFTLAALLILITVVSAPLAYIGQRRTWNQKRKAAVETLIVKRASLWPEVPNDAGSLPHPPGLRPAKTPPVASTGIRKWWNAILLEEATPPIKMVTYATYLQPKDTPPLTDADLQLLTLFPEIEVFDIWGGDLITDDGLKALSKLPNLRGLNFHTLPLVEGDFLRDLPKTSPLASIGFIGMKKLNGQNLSRLSNASALKGISISSCAALTDESLRGVELAPQVESIYLRDCNFGDETVERWLKGRQLKSLTLGAKITRKSAAAIGPQPRLEWLHLMNVPLLDEDLGFLAHCDNLTFLGLEAMPVRGEFLELIPRPEKIRGLELSSTLLEDKHLPKLERLSALGDINLFYTPLTGEGFANCGPFPNGCRIGTRSTHFTDKGKAALATIRFQDGPNTASSMVSLPSNWTPEDFQRFPEGKAPWPVEVDVASARELRLAIGKLLEVYASAGRSRGASVRCDNCPADLMAPVIRLRQLAEKLTSEEEWRLREEYYKMKPATAAAPAKNQEP